MAGRGRASVGSIPRMMMTTRMRNARLPDNAITDAWGHEQAANLDTATALPEFACAATLTSERLVQEGDKRVAVHDLEAVAPSNADVRSGDLILEIVDRQGNNVLMDGATAFVDTVSTYQSHKFIRAQVREPGG